MKSRSAASMQREEGAAGAPSIPKRAYVQRARAEATEVTRGKILAAARDLLFASAYQDVTVQAVADRAAVSLNTVLRHFGSKEGLLRQGMEQWSEQESRLRSVRPGDVAGVVRVLADRYEETGDVVARYAGLAEEVPVLREVFHRARMGHHAWLADVFAPYLPKRHTPTRARRLAALFAATELASWRAWRIDFGFSKAAAERVLHESLDALVVAWATSRNGGMR
jgi:AcrR family transcriptional regulator